jgi:hypothetical protein
MLLLAILAFAQCLPGLSQVRDIRSISSGTRIVSPAVVATTIATNARQGNGELELLVLWRAEPGWFMEHGATGTSQRTSGRTLASSSGGAIVTIDVGYGGTELILQYDEELREATVGGIDVPLRPGDNVILVDLVGSPRIPRILGTRMIDRTLRDHPARFENLALTPELVEFLDCEARMDDPAQQAMIGLVCASIESRN